MARLALKVKGKSVKNNITFIFIKPPSNRESTRMRKSLLTGSLFFLAEKTSFWKGLLFQESKRIVRDRAWFVRLYTEIIPEI